MTTVLYITLQIFILQYNTSRSTETYLYMYHLSESCKCDRDDDDKRSDPVPRDDLDVM
jgi:hypothetical protein